MVDSHAAQTQRNNAALGRAGKGVHAALKTARKPAVRTAARLVSDLITGLMPLNSQSGLAAIRGDLRRR